MRVKGAHFGIQDFHLADRLLDRASDTTVLVDTAPRGDAHGMNPGAIFAMLTSLGGVPGRVLIVDCDPASTEEWIGVSDEVAHRVEAAS